MPKLWLITPVYLDTVAFGILRQRIRDEVAEHGWLAELDVQFVVVDDTAGLDPDIEDLDAHGDVTVIVPPFNLGHQRAIVYALRALAGSMADDDYVVTMDADGEDAPEDVPRLLDELRQKGSHRGVVVALRTSRQETVTFKLFYAAFRVLFLVLTGATVRSGNFAAYHGWVARGVLRHPSFDVCYSATLTSLDLPVTGIPCARAARYAGKSRMSLVKLVRHGLSMLMPYLDRIAIRALILFSAIVTACLALGTAVVAIKIGTHHAIPGWATTTLLGLAISSLVAVGNFVILFAVYTQSRGMALSRLEEEEHGRA
jgi:glycosyltransferase involved in cell wall biosynthesis